MRYYPLLLDLSNAKVLVAGAGEVGCRKAADILVCAPKQLVWLDPMVEAGTIPGKLLQTPGVQYEKRAVEPVDVAGCQLVFAATGSRKVNHMLAEECKAQGIFCNVIDAPGEGSFTVPAHFRKDDFLLALGTGGYSPALAKLLRQELQAWFGQRYSRLLTVMRRLRPLVLARKSHSKNNGSIFRQLVYSGLAVALAEGHMEQAAEILRNILPGDLHKYIGDLLNEPL